MRRLVMAQRMSASISPSPADRYAADTPPPSSPPADRPESEDLGILASGTPPRAPQLPPLQPQEAARGVDAGDLVAAMDMTLRGLKDRARELGVAESSIEDLDDAEDAKAAAVQLVMRATKDKGEVGELTRRHQVEAKRRLRLVTKATLGGVKAAQRTHAFDHLSKRNRSGAPDADADMDGGRLIKGYDIDGDGVIDALDTDGDGLIDTMVNGSGKDLKELQKMQKQREELQELDKVASTVIHVGGLSDGIHENEKRLTKVFSKFGPVLACTMQRRREVEDGEEKVSWALVSYATEAEAAAAVEGTASLVRATKTLPKLFTRTLDMGQALASTGNMGTVAQLHASKTKKGRTLSHATWSPPPRETAVVFEKTIIDLRHTIGASEYSSHHTHSPLLSRAARTGQAYCTVL